MDFDSLLAPISPDAPSGAELRNDPRFHAIERLLEPASRAQRVNPDGTVNSAAPPVEWHRIEEEAEALVADGRDLRLLVIVVRLWYAQDGFGGLANGLKMLIASITDFWDSLHPELRDRPDPKVAALPRVNALKQLENDDNGLLGDLRFGFVLTPRGIGPISGDDLANASRSDFEILNRSASGLSQAEKDEIVAAHGQVVGKVTGATRALAAEEGDRAAQIVADIALCEKGIAALSRAVASAGGFGDDAGVTLPELEEFLGLCRKTIEEGIAATGGETSAEAAPADGVAPETAAPAGAGAPAVKAAPATPGSVGSRADVEMYLDKIVAFYERTEPASPIPLLCRRVRRMVGMDFIELMEEIAPSGLKEFRNIAGVEEQKKK